MNARDYLNSTFLKKADVRVSGPQRLVIQDVEHADGFPGRNGGPAVRELHLIFTDGRRFSLRAQDNLRRMLEAFGDQTEHWRGQTIEVYFNPDIPNPTGGESGGLRLRVPDPGAAPGRARTFQSELEEAAGPSKPAPKATAPGTDDEIPF